MSINVKDICFNIVNECLNKISNSDIDIEDVAFQMGMVVEDFVKIFSMKYDDVSVYLKLNSIVMNGRR